MTRRQLEARVELWRARLCPEWRVVVMDGPPPDAPDRPFVGIVESDLTIEEIRVFFDDDLLEWREQSDVDRVVVHELLHPLLDRVLDHDERLQPFAPPALWDALVEGRRGDMEQLVNRLAHAIVATAHDDWPIYFTSREGAGLSGPTP